MTETTMPEWINDIFNTSEPSAGTEQDFNSLDLRSMPINYEQFFVRFYGTEWCQTRKVPFHVNQKLNQAKTPGEIENIISKHEAELAATLTGEPDDVFLVCDSAAELMSDVLKFLRIQHDVVVGINDAGDSHSYICVGGDRYDPTHQGYGDEIKAQEKEVRLG